MINSRVRAKRIFFLKALLSEIKSPRANQKGENFSVSLIKYRKYTEKTG